MPLSMQALTLTLPVGPYNAAMQTGRPAKHSRPPFGERLHALREQAGLSQAAVAKKLGIAQRSYSAWERRPVALRHEQLVVLADVLGISLSELLGDAGGKKRAAGPVGKLRQVFEQASKLPRSQQAKVAEFVEAFVERQQKVS